MSSSSFEIEILGVQEEVGHVMANIEKEGSVVRGFREADMRLIAGDVFKFCGRSVTSNQVYNHMRHWRVRWIRVLRIKRIGIVRWVEVTYSIIMDDDDYYVHIKAHLKDTELINKYIENYAQMKIIYGPRIPVAPVSLTAIHRALSHLMEHSEQATRYLAMTPEHRMSWFTAFLNKHYL